MCSGRERCILAPGGASATPLQSGLSPADKSPTFTVLTRQPNSCPVQQPQNESGQVSLWRIENQTLLIYAKPAYLGVLILLFWF